MRTAAPLFAVVALLATASAAHATTVAQPNASTPVRAYGGTIVFSTWDATEQRWFLTVREAGAGAPQRLDVASSDTPFDADIGTDSQSRPQLIYQRCDETCDLYVYSLADDSGERPVRNANDPDNPDINPTLWRGRIAWTRVYGTQGDENPIVYTKLLSAPRSQPSKRLPGVPQRRTGDVDPVTGPTTAREVQALELYGDNLAVVVDYSCEGCSGIAQSELRLDSVKQGTSRQVAYTVVGLSGQQLIGPSFFSGNLGWYRSCAVDEPSCRTDAAPWRYGISDRSYERGAAGEIRVDGFADTGSSLYETIDCETPESNPVQSCRIDRLTPPAYEPADAPLR